MGVRVESVFYEKSKFWAFPTYEKSKYSSKSILETIKMR
jgi:hypothetical protein